MDLPSYAKERDLEVHYTDFFSKRESLPGIKANHEIRQTLFSLQENETTDLVELNAKFYIFQVTDRKSSYLPEMEEALDRLRTDFIAHRAAKKARAAAKDYLRSLRKRSNTAFPSCGPTSIKGSFKTGSKDSGRMRRLRS